MTATEPQMILLSQDGPMGFNKMYFMQIVLGCAAAHPDSPGSAAIWASFSQYAKERNSDGGGAAADDDGIGKETADYVQSIIDGRIDDAIAREYFADAQVIENPPGSKEKYDFRLKLHAVQRCIETNQMAIHERFVRGMRSAMDAMDDIDDIDDDAGDDLE